MTFADRLSRGVSSLALRQVLEAFSALAAAILLVRHFGPTGYGILALAVGLAEIASLASGNFEEAVRRFVPEYRIHGRHDAARRVLGVALGTRIGLGIVAAGALAVAAVTIAAVYGASEGLARAIAAAALLIVPIGVNAVAISLLIALDRYSELAIASICGSALALAAAAAAPLLGLGVAAFIILSAAVQFAVGGSVLAYGVRQLWRAGPAAAEAPSQRRAELARVTRYVWPLWGSAVNYTVYQHASRLLLGYFAPLAVVGYFSVAKTLVERITGLYYQLPAALLPSLSQRLAASGAAAANAVVVRLATWVLPLALVMAIASLCFAPELVHVVGGRDFAPAATILAIFSAQFLFRLPSSLWGTLYYLHERTTTLLWMNIARVAPLLLLLRVLVPRWGGHGAAAAEAASYGLSLALFALHVPGAFGIPARAVLGMLGRAVLLLAVVAAVVVLTEWNAPLRWALAAAAPLIVVAAGFIRPDNLDELRAVPLSSAPLRRVQRAVVGVTALGLRLSGRAQLHGKVS